MTDSENEVSILMDAMMHAATAFPEESGLPDLAFEALGPLADLIAAVKPSLSRDQAGLLIAIGGVLIIGAQYSTAFEAATRILRTEGSA